MEKTIQSRPEYYLQFTDEECEQLNLKQGDRFEVIPHDDGSFELQKFIPLELNISEYPREILERLIQESLEQDISVNDVIRNAIKSYIDEDENF
jgi:bifunctional DNA-binding transcriptional regulator/antitoxin component of YhaV-PrlF toxin-antitoxin module